MDFRILLDEQLLFCGKINVLKLMVQLIIYAHVQAWCGHGYKMDNKTPILLNLNRMPCNDSSSFPNYVFLNRVFSFSIVIRFEHFCFDHLCWSN